MKKVIGITGTNGFIARWVIERLGRNEDCEVITLDRSAWCDDRKLRAFATRCEAIVHLASVNRGSDEEVETTNANMARALSRACRTAGASPHIVYSSTTKRNDDTPYGRGKLQAEKVLNEWASDTGGSLTTLVIPNVFGAGCRPFYNSVVATFCQQLSHNETPQITGDAELELLWVGDLAEQIATRARRDGPPGQRVERLRGTAQLKVSELLEQLIEFRSNYFDRDVVPDLKTSFHATLYSTFLSYIDLSDHVHRPPVHSDVRGGLCEVIKTDAGGQVFFSTTAPGVTRGNHYHTRKIELFCVVQGTATIRLRSIHDHNVHEFNVSGDSPEFLSIPVLYTHSIENTGDTELLTLFWTNELFDTADPDTFYEDVLPSYLEAVA